MKTLKLLSCLAGFATFTLAVLNAQAVGTREFILDDGKDFEGGDLEGVAIDSSGRVRAGFNLSEIPIEKGSTIWCTLRQKNGTLLLGTGNDGQILGVSGRKVDVIADMDALAVTSLVEAWGQTYVAAMPGDKVYRLKGKTVEPFAALDGVGHIWQLAFDSARGVLFAATGPDGKLWRISRDGKAELYYDAKEQHLLSLAVANDGSVYTGSSEDARLYRVSGPGRAVVIYDFGVTEVRGIVATAAGDVYAIANEISAGGLSSAAASAKTASTGASSSKSTKTRGKGALYHFSSDGKPTQLLDNSDEHYTSLSVGAEGLPYVGTGGEGKLYTVDAAHNSVLVADVEQRQVSSLALGATGGYVAASDPASLYLLEGTGGPSAVWTSKALDAGIRARFGRLRWASSGTLEFSTRSGNTKDPDETWSDWSASMHRASVIKSPPGRYIQVRARWNKDAAAVLHEVTLPFITDNLRAVVTTIEVGKPTRNTGSGIDSSGGPVEQKSNSDIRLSWKVANPDEDKLRYRVQYQLLGAPQWYSLLKPQEILTDDDYKWDTSALPEGWYRIRVSASDELSNPPNRVTEHVLESSLVLVDNTPPVLRNLEANGLRISGTAVDGAGPIQRIELSVAGTDEWYPFEPEDGIFDEEAESFVADLGFLSLSAPAIIAIRVYDEANNFVVRHISVQP